MNGLNYIIARVDTPFEHGETAFTTTTTIIFWTAPLFSPGRLYGT